MLLGNLIHAALAAIGVTEERVRRWVGECCCRERRERLNALHVWARKTLLGDAGKPELDSLADLSLDSPIP